ncbi:MAG: hypothetical protein II803_04315, partial [Firmicutes bacterium]|nr:hypothetical protein [Bacillota bacterium]
FNKVRSAIDRRNADLRLRDMAKSDLAMMETALKDWPVKKEQLERAESLSQELEASRKKELYDGVRRLKDELAQKKQALDRVGLIKTADVSEADRLSRALQANEALLRGMKIAARISQTGSSEVFIRSAVSGDTLLVGSGDLNITEAAVISIPGVAEIELAPQGVDVESVQTSIERDRNALIAHLKRFNADSAEQLRNKQNESAELSAAVERLDMRIETLLGDTDWNELEAAAAGKNARPAAEVETEIRALSGGSIDRFIGALRSSIDSYI